MSSGWNIFFAMIFFSYIGCARSQPFDYPTANLSTTWINSVTANHSVPFSDSSMVRAILLRGTYGPRYACGFFCSGTCETYLFAIFIVQTNSGGGITSPSIGFPQVVWSANRNNPVRINATLQLTPGGDLVLSDADGRTAWSTGTAGKSVVGLNLTEMGNLVLFDAKNSVVWQSFDHPTDSLVPGQILKWGENLTANASATNWTEGMFTLSMTNKGLVASIRSDPLQVYYEKGFTSTSQNKETSYAKYQNGSIQLYIASTEPSNPDTYITISQAKSAQYMKLGSDGHLRVFEWQTQWMEVDDIFTEHLGSCNYPMVCGNYGICSKGQCTCPRSSSNPESFRQIDDRRPNLGCSEVMPLTCNASSSHNFLDLEDVTYFNFIAEISGIDMNSCKEACLKNCSCKAAIFRYGSNSSRGDCYMPSQIFSLMNNEKDLTHYNSSVFVKVQIAQTETPRTVETSSTAGDRKNKKLLGLILGSVFAIFCVAIVIGSAIFIYQRKKKVEEVEEEYLDHIPGMPTRFSYEELATATDNFNKKLGEGGFGSVFEGLLNDGTRVAVKCLDGVGHIKKSFLVEVETIGSIHHVNLVRLIGFCTEKSHRLLVYEYMCNGSLDRWIYSRNQETSLGWNFRRKIIFDIAKGLAYLHEDCRQKIIHLDIKPQNILLDENYTAKLADFGLSKLIDRNQSQVVTTMRGTPGYLAPEWLNAVITEKVDVYSFGVVILEILCGRKVCEQSKPEEEIHLLSLFTKKAMEGQYLDLVDKCCEDMLSNGAAVVEMMQVAAWCLQSDYVNRPSMSMVIKVLEGVKEVRRDIDYNFLAPRYQNHKTAEIGFGDATPLLPSVLSGPR